ncbi:MAG TPA: hypothetical protein VK041_10110 [Opitutales bacterium]|nr:hypothetical protein [Opitutales bacterium]
MKRYAVLTGDLIESRTLTSAMRMELLQWLKSIAEDFSHLHRDAMVGKPEIFRGDSWQLCLQEPALAVEAAVFIRAGLKAHHARKRIDTRIGIGIGAADMISKDRISESNGEAFLLSGDALDSLDRDLNLSLKAPENSPAVAALAKAAVPLLDLAINRWSHVESVAVFGVLSGWTQQETAEHALLRRADGSHPSRQSVAKALERIHWSSHLEPVLEACRRFLIKKNKKQAQRSNP